MRIEDRDWTRINGKSWIEILDQAKLKIFILILLTITLLTCKKDMNTGLNPVYGPAVTKQFGDVSGIVQEVSFNSNGFFIVGDFRTPVEGEKHPAIIMVHGSGGATRNGAVMFEPLIEIFIRNGYAVFSWDKPGSGESTGEFSLEYRITERANIIADVIEVLSDNTSVISSSIGLWGISEAGWVMPLTLDLINDIAFMIVVSGGGEDSIEQYAYQVAQVVACNGGSIEQVNAVELNWSKMAKATEYNDYKEAVDVLVGIPGVYEHTGITLSAEGQWNPWPREIDAFLNPMDIIEHTTIPLLVFFGELDKNIDPLQGVQAYETALQKAGNQDYMIILIQDVGHVLTPATTGCLNEPVSSVWVTEYLDTLENWIIKQKP